MTLLVLYLVLGLMFVGLGFLALVSISEWKKLT